MWDWLPRWLSVILDKCKCYRARGRQTYFSICTEYNVHYTHRLEITNISTLLNYRNFFKKKLMVFFFFSFKRIVSQISSSFYFITVVFALKPKLSEFCAVCAVSICFCCVARWTDKAGNRSLQVGDLCLCVICYVGHPFNYTDKCIQTTNILFRNGYLYIILYFYCNLKKKKKCFF